MKITFFSTYLNHHQIPFCNEMYMVLGQNFHFIATKKISKERLDLGFIDNSKSFPYSINSYEDPKFYEKAMKLGYESDVVIIGAAPDVFIKERLKENKLTFRYSERLLKKGIIPLLDPRLLKYNIFTHTLYRSKNLHMLCASAYTAYDASILFAYPGKCLKWGYFTEVIEYNIEHLNALKTNEIINILWVGRFLHLKHPEHAVALAKFLKGKKHKFLLSFIGIGEIKAKIEQMVLDFGLQEYVRFLGSMSPDEVRANMLKSNIFIFTSDKREGWGAVLNEAMNSGCAIVASNAIGSVPFLVEDKINGLIYKNGDLTDLSDKVESLIMNPEIRELLGRNAYNTMITLWNPKIAAQRIIHLSKTLLNKDDNIFRTGPCSPATIIKD